MKHTLAFLTTIFLTVLMFLFFYPGILSVDSIIQLTQVSTGHYTDWHPVAMTRLIAVIGQLLPIPQTIIFLQIGFLCFGSFLFYLAWRDKLGRVASLFLFLPLLPFYFNFAGVLWKDAQFGATLFFALAILEYGARSVERNFNFLALFLLSFILIAYAQSIRANGILLTYFIFCYALEVAVEKFAIKVKFKTLKLYSIGAFLSLGTYFANGLYTYNVVNAERKYPLQYIMFYDLVGISNSIKTDFLPSNIVKNHKCENQEIINSFDPRVGDLLFADGPTDSGPCQIVWYSDQAQFSMLRDQWLLVVSKNIFEYLKVRAKFFEIFLRLNSWTSEVAFYTYSAPNNFGLEYSQNTYRDEVWTFYRRFSNTPLFFPWFYIVLILLISVLNFISNSKLVPPILLAGLLGYIIGYYFVGYGPFYRYIYVVPILLTPYLLKAAVNCYLFKIHPEYSQNSKKIEITK